MGKYVYYLRIGKPYLKTRKYQGIKERTDTFDHNKKPLYDPRKYSG